MKMIMLDRAAGWGVVERVRRLLDSIPYSVIALIARAATFTVFWRSGMQKLSDWNSTLMLFTNEYRVPILPPHVAAYIAASLELGGSVLVLMGLMTRPIVFLLLGMVSVIQMFVYPEAWPDHIQWLAFMFVLLARGPGRISLDALIWRVARQSPKAAQETLGATL
jgi:putative oxidoreductase